MENGSRLALESEREECKSSLRLTPPLDDEEEHHDSGNHANDDHDNRNEDRSGQTARAPARLSLDLRTIGIAEELVSGAQHCACILAYFLKSISSSVQSPQLSERQREHAASLLARLQRVRTESRKIASHFGEGGAFQLNIKYHDETRVDLIDEMDGQI
jgi:hypothetical protein